MAIECYTTHLVEGDGTFNGDGLDDFIKQVKLAECGHSYVIVSVMGPQSSGKSTLLNHLFDTNFREMDADMGRTQTTQGIWIARCVGVEPCTIVMDIEGTDGQERGEDDTVFEKQSALFAMTVSDIVILNMWCHDIGREHAANKPLLKTVFQVMLRIFSPRKTTLLFVIRDKTKTPLEKLDNALRKDIYKIWDSVSKPEAHKHSQLSEFFNVEVVALSSYEDNKEQFQEQVARLRQKFVQSVAPGGLASDRRGVVHASDFSLSTKKIWQEIKKIKDLKMPAYRIMVATVRCESIASENYSSFAGNQDWLELQDDVKAHIVPGFGKKLSSLLDGCLSNYDEEVIHYDATVGSTKRKILNEKLMKLVKPTIKSTLKHIRSERMDDFKAAFNNALNEAQGFSVAARDCITRSMRLFDEQCEETNVTIYQAYCDYTKTRGKFRRDLDSLIIEVRAAKLYELTTPYESKFKQALCSQVAAHLKEASDNTWPAIRTLFNRESQKLVSDLSSALSSFGMDEQEKVDMISKLKNYGRGLVEGKAREEAINVNYLMEQRFKLIFYNGNDSKPRDFTENDDIQAIAETAWSSSLKLLSVLAAIRLDGDVDIIWCTLKEGTTTSPHLLYPGTWEEVPAINTLITPARCKEVWDKFKSRTEVLVNEAYALQEKNKTRKMWDPMDTSALKVNVALTLIAFVVCIVSVAAVTTNGNTVVIVVCGVAVIVVVAIAIVAILAYKLFDSVNNWILLAKDSVNNSLLGKWCGVKFS